jgi:hypothetical protein
LYKLTKRSGQTKSLGAKFREGDFVRQNPGLNRPDARRDIRVVKKQGMKGEKAITQRCGEN